MAEHLNEAIQKAGGKAALAKALQVTRSAVSHWVKEGELPVKRAIEIERLTGISRKKLRPDIFGEVA